MKAGKYTLSDFFINRYLKQVIVPEIQRDYVWQQEQLRGLLTSLLKDFKKFLTFKSDVQTEDQVLASSFREYQRRRSCAASIGFVYAYSDTEFAGRYFLIDGQQRITSVFLMLLALAHRQPATLREPFHRTFCAEDRLKLAYQVREASHEFLNKLVPHLLPEPTAAPAGTIEDQAWYYAAARQDTTIQNLVRNVGLLGKIFEEPDFQHLLKDISPLADGEKHKTSEEAFFDYLTNYTEFYYFDTSLSEQGEDLYIYMNARGEQMASNENIKSDLLGQLNAPEEKELWGRKWEDWQDFFWQHRASGGTQNENADDGFNEFLACIAGLTDLVNTQKHTESAADTTSKTRRILASLELVTIEQYVECLRYLSNNAEAFKNEYNYAEWVDSAIVLVWQIINRESTDWNTGKSENRRMTFLWPILRFMVKKYALDRLEPADAFRVLRIHYLRYHNKDRSVAGLEAEADKRIACGVFDITDPSKDTEERQKHTLYRTVAPELTKRYEEIIWEIEDHKFNLDGSDVGNMNISHLVELNSVPTLEDLQKIKNRFYNILPTEKSTYHTLQNILLHYGSYQHRESPSYYHNYNFGNWKRTIRGKGSEEQDVTPQTSAFRRFFDEFLEQKVSLEEFLRQKNTNTLHKEEAQTHHQKVLWYSQQLDGNIWLHGPHIAFAPEWEGYDLHFPDVRHIYNTYGSFRGYNRSKLQDLLPTTTTE